MIESNLLTQTAYRFADWMLCNVGAYSYLVEEGFCCVSVMKHASGGGGGAGRGTNGFETHGRLHHKSETRVLVAPSKRTDVFQKWKKKQQTLTSF